MFVLKLYKPLKFYQFRWAPADDLDLPPWRTPLLPNWPNPRHPLFLVFPILNSPAKGQEKILEPLLSVSSYLPGKLVIPRLWYRASIADSNSNAPRKRRSRWGDAKVELPGLPTAISADGVSQAQLDNYAIHLRLEEINRKLRLNDYIPPEKERYAYLLLCTLLCLIVF